MLLGAVGVGAAGLLSLVAVLVASDQHRTCTTGAGHERCIAAYTIGGFAAAVAAFTSVVVGLVLAQRRVRAGDPRGWRWAAYGIAGLVLAPVVGLLAHAVAALGS